MTVGDLYTNNTQQSPSTGKVDNVFVIKRPSRCKRMLFGINLIADGNGTIYLASLDNRGEVSRNTDHFVTIGLNIIGFDGPIQAHTLAIKASSTVIIPGKGNTKAILYPNSSLTKGNNGGIFNDKESQSSNTTISIIEIFQGMHHSEYAK